jgi:glycosyltransferase involved in cell wall biosynthesis
VVTGKPSVDRIYERMQRLEASELRRELGIRDDQPVILCSVPQLGEHRLLTWFEHWRETEFLFATLTQQPGAAVILSIHPQSDPEAYRPLASKYGAVIARQRIYDLIPVCDILVATYSSVVVQAIGCGKPAIVIDFYGLGFNYYDNEPGVLVTRDRDQLTPAIQRLIYNRPYYEQMAEAQRQRSPEWVLLDGQCTQRVVDEIYQMVAD